MALSHSWFVQKQVPDRRRNSNKTTLTLTLPSDGRGNSQTRHSQVPKRLDSPTDGGRFSLSHPMGEGRGEGECVPKSEVVFARVLTSAATVNRSAESTSKITSMSKTESWRGTLCYSW